MADFSDIDAFFSGKKALERQANSRLTLRTKILRFLKLAMPSAAAVLIALVLLFPSLKENTVVADLDVTLPKKGELEKLHIEKTEFAITDKDNKVSTFTADRIDETEPGTKLMKIINPKAKIPAGGIDEFVYLDSDVGFYDQTANIITSEQNVKAVHDNGTTVLTEIATYNFNTAYGSGDKDIYAFGDWGKLWADGFEYFQPQELLILNGKSKIVSGERTLWADQQVRYFRFENKIEAEGNVVVLENNNVLKADKMVAYFKGTSPSEIKRIEAFGHVKVDTADGQAQGDKGLYQPEKSELELEGNVVVKQDGHVIYGQKAITNLKTSVSKIVSGKENGKRVSGVIKGSSIKGKKNEKK